MIIQYTSVTDTREINVDLLLLINNRSKTVFVVRVCISNWMANERKIYYPLPIMGCVQRNVVNYIRRYCGEIIVQIDLIIFSLIKV